jgi:low temperature requirement protein LtrA
VLAAADGYSYLHLVLVAGIIVFAVGAKDAVAGVAEPLSDAARLALCGGTALYLAGHAGFRLRMTGTLRYAKLVAAAACLVLFAAAPDAPAWATAGLLTGVLAVLVGFEAISERASR